MLYSLFFGDVVIVDSCIGKIIVIVLNIYFFPILLTSGVIYVSEVFAITERIITNTRHTVGDGDGCKARATVDFFSQAISQKIASFIK